MLTQTWVNVISIAIVAASLARVWSATHPPLRLRATAKDDQGSFVDAHLLSGHIRHNRLEIEHSTTCGCLSCGQMYRAGAVTEWRQDSEGWTAMCPRCGADAVVGSAAGFTLTPELLRRSRAIRFSEERAS